MDYEWASLLRDNGTGWLIYHKDVSFHTVAIIKLSDCAVYWVYQMAMEMTVRKADAIKRHITIFQVKKNPNI